MLVIDVGVLHLYQAWGWLGARCARRVLTGCAKPAEVFRLLPPEKAGDRRIQGVDHRLNPVFPTSPGWEGLIRHLPLEESE